MGFGTKLFGGVLAAAASIAVVDAIVSDDSIKVIRVVDGDTIDVSKGGEEVRVRFLNVNTPEIGKDGLADECLAKEAKEFLESRLPKDTHVKLEYDVEKQDKYGRDLAGVFIEDSLVNAEIAAEGLGVAMVVGENRRFYDQVLAAEKGPRSERSGIFGVAPSCMTIDLGAKSALAELEKATTELEAVDIDDLADVRAGLDLVKKTRHLLHSGVLNEAATSEFQRAAYSDEFEKVVAKLDSEISGREKELADALRDEEKRLAEEHKKAEENRRKQEEKAEKERKSIEENEHRSAQVDEPAVGGDRIVAPRQPAPAQPAPNPAPVGDNYTGCRAYGGNYSFNNVDKNGRRYAKIDCTTKQQIG